MRYCNGCGNNAEDFPFDRGTTGTFMYMCRDCCESLALEKGEMMKPERRKLQREMYWLFKDRPRLQDLEPKLWRQLTNGRYS